MSSTATPADVLAGNARWCVVEGDAAEVLRALPDGVATAVVTYPPSGIAFMGAEWDRDKGGRAQWVAWLAGILAEARRCTRDGGRSVVWSLPRTSHWTGCAVEDAGWSIETTVQHLYGTGWPKGKSQTKPAAETWWLARTGRSTDLNIDACRLAPGLGGTREGEASAERRYAEAGGTDFAATPGPRGGSAEGRWPPNVALSHAPGCVLAGVRRVASASAGYCGAKGVAGGLQSPGSGWGTKNTGEAVGYADPDGTETVDAWECVEGCAVASLGAQAGERSSGDLTRVNRKAFSGAASTAGATFDREGDTGTASRYFPQFEHEAPFLYCAKPSNAEKRAGLTDDDPRHPTVKPVDLMRWLIRLVTQPGDVVLDPFCGSATTGVAALLEGRRFIGIERAPDAGERAFAPIARARLEHAAPSRERLATMASTPVRVEAADFGPLFNR